QGNVVRDNVVGHSGRADLSLAGPAGAGNCFSGNDYRTSLPPAIQATHGCGFDLNRLGGGDLSATIQTLALYIRAQSGKYPTGDWRTAPAPPAQPNAPPICGGAVDCPPLRLGPPGDPANPGTRVPGPTTVDDPVPPSDHASNRRQEVTVLGISILAAPTWW